MPSFLVALDLVLTTASVPFLLQKGHLAGTCLSGRGVKGLPAVWGDRVSCQSRQASPDLTQGPVSVRLQPAAVGNMPRFLQYLTTQLHQQVPGGLVLWYDSVVTSGQLRWQDELNEQNR